MGARVVHLIPMSWLFKHDVIFADLAICALRNARLFETRWIIRPHQKPIQKPRQPRRGRAPVLRAAGHVTAVEEQVRNWCNTQCCLTVGHLTTGTSQDETRQNSSLPDLRVKIFSSISLE